MSVPASRQDFKYWCLRKLGHPVIEINVADEQVEDRIDEALIFFQDYHYEGTEKTYYKYALTQTDITNQYIPVPDGIVNVTRVFPIGESLSSNNLFNIRYQITLNDLYDLTSTTMVPYYLAMQHIQSLEQMLVGQQPVRYNRYTNIIYIDMDWSMVGVGQYLIFEVYQVVDPTTYTAMWGDRFLQQYATALIKRQWGDNLTKYSGVNLPGGMKFNAEKIRDDADKEVEKLEQEMIRNWSLPVDVFIG